MVNETYSSTYEEFVECINKHDIYICEVCVNRDSHNCDAGGGYTVRDEYGECPSGDFDEYGEPTPTFELMSKEEYEQHLAESEDD